MGIELLGLVLCLFFLFLVVMSLFDDDLSDTFAYNFITFVLAALLTFVYGSQIGTDTQSGFTVFLTILWGFNTLLRLLILLVYIETH